jgi:hypothetical protein
MPQLGDVVLVGFDTNSTVRILGYDTISYQLLADLQDEENITFFELQPGEFDKKSSGGAYIKGDRLGGLFLAGGLQSIALDKKAKEVLCRTSTSKSIFEATISRQGVAKRSPTKLAAEIAAKRGLGIQSQQSPGNAALPNLYESTLDLRQPSSAVPFGLPVLFSSSGDVLDPDVDEISQSAWGSAGPLGVKKVDATSTFARVLFRLYDANVDGSTIGTPGKVGGTSFRPFEVAIDLLGNLVINQGALAAKGFLGYFPNQFEITTVLSTLHTTIAKLGDKNTSTEPVICGNLFLTATQAFCTAHSAWVAAVESYSIAVAVYNAVTAAAFATAAGGAGLITPAIGAPVAAGATAFIAAQAAFISATSTYTAAITTYVNAVQAALSRAVFVSLNGAALVPGAPSENQI